MKFSPQVGHQDILLHLQSSFSSANVAATCGPKCRNKKLQYDSIPIITATVEHENMNNFLRNRIDTNSWIGLNDKNEEGRYRWVHEDMILQGYTNWDTPSLSLFASENDCAFMLKTTGATNGKWTNTNCDDRMSFVCERRRSSNRPVELRKQTQACE